MEKKKCFAYIEGVGCKIFEKKRCSKCRFFKTFDKFIEDEDNAILICREKGLCDSCKYSRKKCQTNLS